MKPFTILVRSVAIALTVLAALPFASARGEDEASPVLGGKLPAGYRDWGLISVAHEEGSLNDLRAVLGNDAAIKAYREGKLPFPDGAIIARLAWSYVPSEENNKAFGRAQSFVAGSPTNLQFMVKDCEKIRRDRRLGVRSIRRRQARPRGGARLLCLPRARQGAGLPVHPLRTVRNPPNPARRCKILGELQWFETTSRAKTFSNQFSRKISTGSRSRRFRRRRDWPCLLATLREPDLI